MRWIQVLACPAFLTLTYLSASLCAQIRAAEPAPSADVGNIVVHVISSAGTPEPDAAVSLFVFDRDWWTFKNMPRDATTDSTGVVRFNRLATDKSYLVRAKSHDGLVGYRECMPLYEKGQQDVELKVLRPATATIHVRNESGKPVRGASIWSISHTGPNGSVTFDPQTLIAAGLSSNSSDTAGDLPLPQLPGGKISVRLIHPDFAPVSLKDFAILKDARGDVTLTRGVKLTLHVKRQVNGPLVEGIMIYIQYVPYESPSTLSGQLPRLRPDGTTQLTVAPGKYTSLRLTDPDYVVTPEYLSLGGHGPGDEREYFEIGPGKDQFTFQLHRKVKVRSRVLDAATGKPISGVTVMGDLHSDENKGPFARFAREWAQAGFAETNERGEFEIDLAAGRASVSFASGHYGSPTRYRIDVAADGPTVAPDILVKSAPKIRGVVQDQSGKPLAGAVVRFRGSELNNACSSIVTDLRGRFELSPPFIPTDWKTEEPRPTQTIVAFHPYEPLCAEVRIDLDESTSLESVVLRLKPQDYGTLVTGYPEELTPWERGIVPPDEKDHLAALSLVGKPAPELDGAAWLNTDKPKMSLADFRGKFVLLQFWTTWCGVCHWDMPRVKLVRDLYKDKGLVVIGVHDNSMPLEAIKEDAAKNGMSYPIVVDQPDGRILASYKGRGFQGFPSFILIGPDGRVVKDDQTVAGPDLFSFKTEIIRQFLMAPQAGTEAALKIEKNHE
jgi:thiol-disulfide isomerase/thioredoxin